MMPNNRLCRGLAALAALGLLTPGVAATAQDGSAGQAGPADATPPRPLPIAPRRLDGPSMDHLPEYSGPVGILLLIGTDGKVKGCAITASSGHPKIDTMVCNAARQGRFEPARVRNGTAIESGYATTVQVNNDG